MISKLYAKLATIPGGVWTLGFVSLFMDISSEMIHSLLPIFLTTVLGASMVTVGLIEGLGQATASTVKIFSGTLSDYLGKRKLLAGIGYGLATLCKPLFPLAQSADWILSARLIDRVGKGIRGAPRDALIADLTPTQSRGASFGLRQTLDTIGAFVGPMLALLLMFLLASDIRAVFWYATIPALIAVALLIFGVKEPVIDQPYKTHCHGNFLATLKTLGSAFWIVVVVSGLLTLSRFSEAFLILRAENIGFSIIMIPVVMVIMNMAYAVTAYPAGVLSDHFNRQSLIAVGFVFLIAADIALALASNIITVMLGIALWGIHMGFTHGVLSAWVTDTAPEKLRGTAFGIFHFVSGITLLLASVIAGALWQQLGPEATFYAGAAIAAVALALMFLLLPIIQKIHQTNHQT